MFSTYQTRSRPVPRVPPSLPVLTVRLVWVGYRGCVSFVESAATIVELNVPPTQVVGYEWVDTGV